MYSRQNLIWLLFLQIRLSLYATACIADLGFLPGRKTGAHPPEPKGGHVHAEYVLLTVGTESTLALRIAWYSPAVSCDEIPSLARHLENCSRHACAHPRLLLSVSNVHSSYAQICHPTSAAVSNLTLESLPFSSVSLQHLFLTEHCSTLWGSGDSASPRTGRYGGPSGT